MSPAGPLLETVLAHVWRATVGRVALENTHPFCYRRWAFVHNGTLPRFDELRPKMPSDDDVETPHGDPGRNRQRAYFSYATLGP